MIEFTAQQAGAHDESQPSLVQGRTLTNWQLNAFARSWEVEPPGELRASCSDGASPSRNHARPFSYRITLTEAAIARAI